MLPPTACCFTVFRHLFPCQATEKYFSFGETNTTKYLWQLVQMAKQPNWTTDSSDKWQPCPKIALMAAPLEMDESQMEDLKGTDGHHHHHHHHHHHQDLSVLCEGTHSDKDDRLLEVALVFGIPSMLLHCCISKVLDRSCSFSCHIPLLLHICRNLLNLRVCPVLMQSGLQSWALAVILHFFHNE